MTSATDNRTTELLPCPFCGGEADEHAGIIIGGKKESLHIICETCGAKVYGVLEADAIEAWNTRAELGSGTCEMEYGGDITPNTAKVMGVYFCSECGSPTYNDCMPYYCMYCGKAVKL